VNFRPNPQQTGTIGNGAHCLHRIHDQIQRHLLQLDSIGQDFGNLLEELSGDRHSFHDKTVTVTTCGRICFNRQKISLNNVFGWSKCRHKAGERTQDALERVRAARHLRFCRINSTLQALLSFGNGCQAIETLERLLADFSKCVLKSLDNQADFDSAIPRFESWRPSQVQAIVSACIIWLARLFRALHSETRFRCPSWTMT
jgi:hypothetical protein